MSGQKIDHKIIMTITIVDRCQDFYKKSLKIVSNSWLHQKTKIAEKCIY